ncbi:MAG: hypothetical protein A2672_00360 [Candidatus Wildermuthbacteria bacterium RIFCSPHIGHO2_01_FULL_49_22b]|uniref:TVP38/TMEM64 family membrane protein n=1 Tax=Candidatus Wildermuthbacteria bacterium RIFCSPHIGHO2_01_FULL_49_22b TaxID=1802448 RepID=A0A1G2QZ87_9BACT|nr:MAG: hypothetical protein A2672_00360 [Candidatus Wildermuthbacteria bacterium RIFCSPHIGHO2_01_FULL_49_22b]
MKWRIMTLVFFIGLILLGWYYIDWSAYIADPELIRDAISTHKYWTPVVFIVVQIIGELMLVPGTPFTIAGGLMFGVFWGSIFSLFCSVVSSMLIFWAMRYVGNSSIIQYLHDRFEIMRRYNLALENHGLRHVIIMRVLPFAPNNFLNIGYGLTKVSSKDFALGTLLGNLPSTIVLSYFGNLVVTADDLNYVILAVAGIILVSYLWFRYGGGDKLISGVKSI